MYSPTPFERVTFKPEGATRAQTIYLRDVTEGPQLISGTQVDKHGGQVGDPANPDVCARQHVIDKSLVSKRVPHRLSLHYGVLEPVE